MKEYFENDDKGDNNSKKEDEDDLLDLMDNL